MPKGRGSCWSQATLACVKDSTPPQGSEIHGRLGPDATIRPIPGAGADIARPVHVAVDHSAAAKACIHPPSRRTVCHAAAAAACSGGVVLLDLLHSHSIPGCFISQILYELAMRPLADLLVRSHPQVNLILDVAHIPDRNGLHPVHFAELHHLAAGFVQEVSLLPAKPCTSPSLASQQPAVALGAGLASIDQGCQGSVTFVPQPLDQAQRAPGDD